MALADPVVFTTAQLEAEEASAKKLAKENVAPGSFGSDAGATVRLEEGRYTIHVPCSQQTEHVALTLEVKAPGEEFKVFDLTSRSPILCNSYCLAGAS
jgi:hypothetical protein